MTASPPTPAALAPLQRARDTVYVLDVDGTNLWWATVYGPRLTAEQCEQIAERILAALAAPAPAVVGEDLRKAVAKAIRESDGICEDPDCEQCLEGADAAIAVMAAAPRPSRDDTGQVVAGYLVFDKDGRYLDFQTGFDIADGDRKAGLTSRPVYFHPPAPSAEAGRVGELEAALRELADVASRTENGHGEDEERCVICAAVRRGRAALSGGAS
jgi:hypothetical protein